MKLKKAGPGNQRTVPAIIPACSSCNRGGKKFEWNADAILLTGSRDTTAGTEPVFFGKLFLHEEKKGKKKIGPYWTKVHRVKRTTFEGKKLTGVQGEVTLKTCKKLVGVPPEIVDTRQRVLRREEHHYLGRDEFKSSTVKWNKITGEERVISEDKDWYLHEWWWYEDDTGFVYDLLRGATVDHPIVSVRNRAKDRITKKMTEFSEKEVIDRVQRVHVKHAEQALSMPTAIEQIVHSMRCLAIEHGLLDSAIYMDDILKKFASLLVQIEEEENDARVQEFVSNGFLYPS